MPENNEDEYKELKSYFDSFDKDGNGLLDNHEFANLVDTIGKEAIGPKLSQEEVETAFNNIDKDNSGTIDFEEFIKWLGGQ